MGFTVTVGLTVPGIVSDYTPAVVADVAALFARRAGVTDEYVSVSVLPASVLLLISILAVDENAAGGIAAVLDDVTANATAATAFLADVEVAGGRIVVEAVQPLTVGSTNGSDGGAGASIALGLMGGVIMLVTLLMLLRVRQRHASKARTVRPYSAKVDYAAVDPRAATYAVSTTAARPGPPSASILTSASREERVRAVFNLVDREKRGDLGYDEFRAGVFMLCFYERSRSEADRSKLPPANTAGSLLEPTEEEVRQWFDEHMDEYAGGGDGTAADGGDGTAAGGGDGTAASGARGRMGHADFAMLMKIELNPRRRMRAQEQRSSLQPAGAGAVPTEGAPALAELTEGAPRPTLAQPASGAPALSEACSEAPSGARTLHGTLPAPPAGAPALPEP